VKAAGVAQVTAAGVAQVTGFPCVIEAKPHNKGVTSMTRLVQWFAAAFVEIQLQMCSLFFDSRNKFMKACEIKQNFDILRAGCIMFLFIVMEN
jgi:hypothetical protein